MLIILGVKLLKGVTIYIKVTRWLELECHVSMNILIVINGKQSVKDVLITPHKLDTQPGIGVTSRKRVTR